VRNHTERKTESLRQEILGGVRPVEDRERLTPARPGLFVATARVREEYGRGFLWEERVREATAATR